MGHASFGRMESRALMHLGRGAPAEKEEKT